MQGRHLTGVRDAATLSRGGAPQRIVMTRNDFSATDWETENRALLEGGDPQACPECGRTGFYGPRRGGPQARYRACTFCGFRQEVGAAPVRDRAWSHACERWPWVAGAPLVEWAPADAESVECPYCGGGVDLEAHRVTAPAEDEAHPWRSVPQGLSGVESLKYWRAQLESLLPLFSRLYL